MEYVIAIPTYKRYCIKTLEYLKREQVPAELITIFVADQLEYDSYYARWGTEFKIVIGVLGIGSQRNFITSYYPVGTYVVSMDDDIRDLYNMKGVGFNVWIQECLQWMHSCNINLLGVNPTSNVYWRMSSKSPTFQSGRYFAVGVFHIYRIHELIEPLTFTLVEDYERSIKYLHQDGAVGRYNGVVLKTTFWANGGLKEARTKDAYCEAVNLFASQYSDDVYITMKCIPSLSKLEMLPNIRILKKHK